MVRFNRDLTLKPYRTKAALKIMKHVYVHGPTPLSAFIALRPAQTPTNTRRTVTNLEDHGYLVLNHRTNKFTFTQKALDNWPDVFDKIPVESFASSTETKPKPKDAPAIVKSLPDIGPALAAKGEQVPGGISSTPNLDRGRELDRLREEMRENIRQEVRAEERAKVRATVRATIKLPFTIGGKTTTAYTIDEGLAACTAYMQAANEFLSKL